MGASRGDGSFIPANPSTVAAANLPKHPAYIPWAHSRRAALSSPDGPEPLDLVQLNHALVGQPSYDGAGLARAPMAGTVFGQMATPASTASQAGATALPLQPARRPPNADAAAQVLPSNSFEHEPAKRPRDGGIQMPPERSLERGPTTRMNLKLTIPPHPGSAAPRPRPTAAEMAQAAMLDGRRFPPPPPLPEDAALEMVESAQQKPQEQQRGKRKKTRPPQLGLDISGPLPEHRGDRFTENNDLETRRRQMQQHAKTQQRIVEQTARDRRKWVMEEIEIRTGKSSLYG